jgi:nucleoside-diphosphate-sugar epimerase
MRVAVAGGSGKTGRPADRPRSARARARGTERRPRAVAAVVVDEEHPLRPESSYALSKVLGEEMARQFSRWSGIPFIGLRFSNVMVRADYERVPSF